MNILITGARGFVGGHLIKELKDNGHNVTAAIHSVEAEISDVTCVKADLMVFEQVNAQIDFKAVDAVIHLAGLAAVGPSFTEPHKYLNVNAGIEINLFEACIKQNSSPKFLVISSGTLYNPKQPMPLDESSDVIPTSPYAVSKVAQESLAQYYSNRGFNYIIARPFNHIGPGQNPGFIVPDFAKQIVAVERGEATSMAVGNLEAKRDYTDVRDIVKAYRLLVESNNTTGKIYNISSGNSVSGNDILQTLLSLTDAKVEITQNPDLMRPSDIPEIIGNHQRITDDTNWQPTIPLKQTLQDALNDYRSRLQ